MRNLKSASAVVRYDPPESSFNMWVGKCRNSNIKSWTGGSPGAGGISYVYPTQGSAAVLPHAVQTIDGRTYEYDSNGNMSIAPGRTYTWNSFDMPVTMTKGTSSSSFVYGPEHQRTRQTRSDGSVEVSAGAQVTETKAGVLTVKTYWPYGVGVEIDVASAPATLNWVHSDRLGSPVAISDRAGMLKEKLAYDAWGKRRTTDGSNTTPDTLDGVVDNRGFTGHEMLDQLDLVHMNGRVYDPAIGRFLTGDPFVQEPTNGQSYNRYSYVVNNPTNLTDPTGFEFCGIGSRDSGLLCPDSPRNPSGRIIVDFDDDKDAKSTVPEKASTAPGGKGKVPVPSTGSANIEPSGMVKMLNYLKTAEEIVQGVKGTAKVVTGGLTATAGGAICTGVVTCLLGAPVAAVGLSEVTQGSTMVRDAVSGVKSDGYNPLKVAANKVSPKYGDASYDAVALAANLGALYQKVPLVMGTADGMNRSKSMFGATVSVWENAKFVPAINLYLTQSVMQLKVSAAAVYSTYVLGNDMNKPERP